MKRMIAFVFLIIALYATLYYTWCRIFGVTYVATWDAFLPPDTGELVHVDEKGRIELHLNLTPAPWPEEATGIFWHAKFGVPTHVVIKNPERSVAFTILRIDKDRNFVVVPKTNADLNVMIEVLKLRR